MTAAQHPLRIFDPYEVRQEFPALNQEVNGKPLVYLDNAATSQKPESVLQAMMHYYRFDNANVHRAAHTLSDRATRSFEQARLKVRSWLNAASPNEIIWTRGTTEAINLVAQSYGRSHLKAGDEIIISGMEHHSNIVPWQLVAQQTGALIKVIPVRENGTLDMDAYRQLLSERTKLVAVVHASNALGTINPVKEIIRLARQAGAVTLIDGAQASAHLRVDVQDLDCDFYALSGHKMFGPTGIGVLYGRESLLSIMPPWQAGGEMIDRVSFDTTTFNDLPFKFEAGTPAISQAIGFGAALDYLSQFNWEDIMAHEHKLLDRARELSQEIPGIRVMGDSENKVALLSFVVEGIHPSDFGTLLDHQGIAVRTGHHCCMPLMDQLAIPGTTRASFAFYNTLEDVEALFRAIQKIQKMFV